MTNTQDAAKRWLHCDIETFSSQPLPKCGVYRYSQAPDFQILLVTYGYNDEELITIDLARGEHLPPDFLAALEDPNVLKIAHNAAFERVCFSRYLGHWLDPHQWRCSMVMASYMTLPLKLADVAVALNLTERKMEEGKDLIRFFSVPCKPTKANGGRTRNLPGDAPDKWELYKKYNRQDVETERAVFNALLKHPMPESEWELYALDQIINDRGVRIDKQLVHSALIVDSEFTQKAYQRAQEITGLENPSSVVQLKAWLADQDMPMETLAKKVVQEKAKNAEGIVAELLRLRLELSKTSVKKYEAMARTVCKDGRIHGVTQFYGASRTGRFSGRLVQLQNVPQNHLPDLDTAKNVVKSGDEEMVEMLYGSVPNTLSELIRTALIPKDGCRFLVADFSAIEARTLAWLAGEEWVLEEFRGKGKIYEATAARMYHIPVDTIVKGNPNYEYRQKGKQATLACIAEGEPVLTNHGLKPIETVNMNDLLWDGKSWVSHEGVVYKGERNVITYEGLTATPDHIVWIEGQSDPVYFGIAAARSAHLVQAGNGRCPIRLTGNHQPGEALEPLVYPEPGLANQSIAKVYDIRNAGPHHRFTVSGHLVHNCGYGGGVGAMKNMGATMPDEELQDIVEAWRRANPHIVNLWAAMERTARRVTDEKITLQCGKLVFYWREVNMFIRLPSGRELCYQGICYTNNRFGNNSLGYYMPGSAGKMILTETFGGKLVENSIQGIARDILANSMLALERAGYRIVFHVHDEILEVPYGQGSLEDVCRIMGIPPAWAPDLPLRADGDELSYYRKM